MLKYKVFIITVICCGALQGCRNQKNNIGTTKVNDKYELSKSEKKYLNQVIDSMYALDQGKRHEFTKIDSTFGINNHDISSIKSKREIKKYKKAIDSLWIIVNNIDDSNTQMLMEIIKDYGFPNNKRLGVYKSKAYFILVHSPREYFDDIRKLINSEYEAERIEEYKKEYIFWHLNGRNGMPPRRGANGEAIW